MHLQTALSLIDAKCLSHPQAEAWADLGAGDGLFTMALASLLTPGSSITAVDKKVVLLRQITIDPRIELTTIAADFVKDDLPLGNLDGILMANGLHFVKDKPVFLQKLRGYLRSGAHMIIVEYDTSQANRWVPYPLTVFGYRSLFADSGFTFWEVIAQTKSRYQRANITGFLVR